MATESKVTLKSSDNVLFEVNEPVALQSQIIKNIVEDVGTATAIPLPNVCSQILSKVIKYCNYHVEAHMFAFTDSEIKAWDQKFVKVDQPTLFHLIRAANYLDIYSLLDLTCEALADNVKEKSIEEIRKIFKIISKE